MGQVVQAVAEPAQVRHVAAQLSQRAMFRNLPGSQARGAHMFEMSWKPMEQVVQAELELEVQEAQVAWQGTHWAFPSKNCPEEQPVQLLKEPAQVRQLSEQFWQRLPSKYCVWAQKTQVLLEVLRW